MQAFYQDTSLWEKHGDIWGASLGGLDDHFPHVLIAMKWYDVWLSGVIELAIEWA